MPTSEDVQNEVTEVKRAISLVRSGAQVFENIGMQKTATALRNYMRELAPTVKELEDEAKPSAEIIILTPSNRSNDDAE